jgi:ATP-dependent RNA helicase DDX55/SPB4
VRDKEGKIQDTATPIPTRLNNFYHLVKAANKPRFVVDFVQKHGNTSKIIIFFLTCASVDYWTAVLPQLEALKPLQISVTSLHGKMNAKKRKAKNKKFKAAENGILCCTDVAARGLDVPDVDWILQFDPPQDPDNYVHRVGRTARAGRSGKALLLLMPCEALYINFLSVSKVPVDKATEETIGMPLEAVPEEDILSDSDDDEDGGDEDVVMVDAVGAVDDDGKTISKSSEEQDKKKAMHVSQPIDAKSQVLIEQLKQLQIGDRAIMEFAVSAFISYIRGYKEHTAKYILIFKKLPFAELAHAFGLLFLPSLPDLFRYNIQYEKYPIVVKTIAYKDKRREKQRKANFEVVKARNAKEKSERLQKGKDKEKYLKEKAKKLKLITSTKKRKAAALQSDIDADARDERLYKLMRKGKITKAEYNEMTGDTMLENSIFNR